MKKWQVEALRKIEIAAEEAMRRVLKAPDNDYTYVHGEIDIWLCRQQNNVSFGIKIFQPF